MFVVQLVTRNQGQLRKRVRVDEPIFLIGRAEGCHLRASSRTVSNKHCVIVQREKRVYIKDLDSRNGVFVNGHQIGPGRATRLFHRDKLQIGKMRFRVLIQASESDAPEERPEEVERISPSDTVVFLNKAKFHSIKPKPLKS